MTETPHAPQSNIPSDSYWLILHNHLDNEPAHKLFGDVPRHLVGWLKTSSAPDLTKHGTPFRLFDDDGELYFSGVYFGDQNSQDAFDPLDRFGEKYGCTEIQYLNPATQKYETL